jgi:hypothetical protein
VDKLISFVMSNFYIVVVVIGIIYSLFFRKSSLERPRNRMPDFGGSGQQRPGRPDESRPTVAPPTRPEPQEVRFPAPQRQNPPPVRLETRSAEQRKSPQHSLIAAPIVTDVSYSGGGAPERQATISQQTVKPQPVEAAFNRLDARGLTREDLSRAVLWAEILGPPRARRPHRR